MIIRIEIPLPESDIKDFQILMGEKIIEVLHLLQIAGSAVEIYDETRDVVVKHLRVVKGTR